MLHNSLILDLIGGVVGITLFDNVYFTLLNKTTFPDLITLWHCTALTHFLNLDVVHA